MVGQNVLQLKGSAVSPTRIPDDSILAVLAGLQGLSGQNVLQLKGPAVSPIGRSCEPYWKTGRRRSNPGRLAGIGWPECFAAWAILAGLQG